MGQKYDRKEINQGSLLLFITSRFWFHLNVIYHWGGSRLYKGWTAKTAKVFFRKYRVYWSAMTLITLGIYIRAECVVECGQTFV